VWTALNIYWAPLRLLSGLNSPRLSRLRLTNHPLYLLTALPGLRSLKCYRQLVFTARLATLYKHEI